MARRPMRAAGLALLALGAVLPSCRDATQIVLHIRSDVPCAARESWRGVAVSVGEPGAALERQAPALVTTSCEPNRDVGSLVIVPSGDKDAEVGIVVVAGVERNPEECQAANYRGCIVARRTLRFAPHGELGVDIELVPDCLNIGCSATQTCVGGACVDSRSPEPAPDGGDRPPTADVRCGDYGVRCSTEGEVCCLTVDVASGKSQGDCRKPELCLGPSITLRCDDDTDCPRGGDGGEIAGVCALSYARDDAEPYQPTLISHAECRLATFVSVGDVYGLGLCEKRQGCADDAFTCRPSESALLPGYLWCLLDLANR